MNIDFSGENLDIMKRIRKILKEVHLYTNKIEMLIKFIIWGISWIGGILVLQSTQDKKAVGSAYLIFALSLLMEFAAKIKDKKDIFSKIIHTIFCSMMVGILFMAVMILFGMKLEECYYDVMFGLSVAIMIFMSLDFLIFWLGTEYINEVVDIQQKEIKPVYNERELFKSHLYNGNLGNIEKGEQIDE